MEKHKNQLLFTRPIAHRGLWNKDIPENSLLAYKNAVDNGFPIEIDLYGTKDGEIVVFHDQNTFRLTGVYADIFDLTLAEIKELNIGNSEQKIPTLKEVLDLVNGQIPLLIEFKNQPNNSYAVKAVELLKQYPHEFAVQSFNPVILLKIKKLAPHFTLGVLTTKKFDKGTGLIKRLVVGHMLLNRKVKPDFISYDKELLFSKKVKKFKGKKLAWTIISKDEYLKVLKLCDNAIFEHFIP